MSGDFTLDVVMRVSYLADTIFNYDDQLIESLSLLSAFLSLFFSL